MRPLRVLWGNDRAPARSSRIVHPLLRRVSSNGTEMYAKTKTLAGVVLQSEQSIANASC